MLSRQEAHILATQILQQAKAESDARNNAWAPRVSWVYRCPELKGLSPWQQTLILSRAKEQVEQNRRIRIFVIAMLVGLILVQGTAWLLGKYPPFLLFIIIPLLRIFWIRSAVRQLAITAKKQMSDSSMVI